jgi:hypothetical protein
MRDSAPRAASAATRASRSDLCFFSDRSQAPPAMNSAAPMRGPSHGCRRVAERETYECAEEANDDSGPDQLHLEGRSPGQPFHGARVAEFPGLDVCKPGVLIFHGRYDEGVRLFGDGGMWIRALGVLSVIGIMCAAPHAALPAVFCPGMGQAPGGDLHSGGPLLLMCAAVRPSVTALQNFPSGPIQHAAPALSSGSSSGGSGRR